ncbi:hypothetical protein [Streptomyces clavifer]
MKRYEYRLALANPYFVTLARGWAAVQSPGSESMFGGDDHGFTDYAPLP